jgi:hypothetical protein
VRVAAQDHPRRSRREASPTGAPVEPGEDPQEALDGDAHLS